MALRVPNLNGKTVCFGCELVHGEVAKEAKIEEYSKYAKHRNFPESEIEIAQLTNITKIKL
jgi:hypothetical protein